MQRKSTKVEHICKRCGESFPVSLSNHNRGMGKFCSWECRNPQAIARLGFWAFVQKTENCWLWTGYTMKHGYGSLFMDGKKQLAHRVSWELHFGPIPDGLRVLHNCPDGDNPRCVNPAHLFLGTSKDNTQDMLAKGREARGERHGHAIFTEQDIRDIRRRYAQGGISMTELGKEYGVRGGTVSKIVHWQRWKHVTELSSPARTKPGQESVQ